MTTLSEYRGKQLVLDVEGADIALAFDADSVQSLLIGRVTTPESADIIDVDLALYGAADHGVSRQHARIMPHKDKLCIVDLNSTSGTYLNGKQLEGGVPYRLRHGDQLSLGKLVLQVRFEPKPSGKGAGVAYST